MTVENLTDLLPWTSNGEYETVAVLDYDPIKDIRPIKDVLVDKTNNRILIVIGKCTAEINNERSATE